MSSKKQKQQQYTYTEKELLYNILYKAGGDKAIQEYKENQKGIFKCAVCEIKTHESKLQTKYEDTYGKYLEESSYGGYCGPNYDIIYGLCSNCYSLHEKIFPNFIIFEFIHLFTLPTTDYIRDYYKNIEHYRLTFDLTYTLLLCYKHNTLFPIIKQIKKWNMLLNNRKMTRIFITNKIPEIVNPFIIKYFKENNNIITKVVGNYIKHFESLKDIPYQEGKTVFNTIPNTIEYIIPFSINYYYLNKKYNITYNKHIEILTVLLLINRFEINNANCNVICLYKTNKELPKYKYETLSNELVTFILMYSFDDFLSPNKF